jgi:hypothetical protein
LQLSVLLCYLPLILASLRLLDYLEVPNGTLNDHVATATIELLHYRPSMEAKIFKGEPIYSSGLKYCIQILNFRLSLQIMLQSSVALGARRG